MAYDRICLSSGHGKYVAGACGILMEHEEAVRVVDAVAKALRARGCEVMTFEDTVSVTQNENLNRIVDWHNGNSRDLDISVHFNAYEQVSKPMGTEVLYVTQSTLAGQVSSAIASVGFINRGPKKRTDLFFLNNTAMPAILIEVCFVDSEADAEIYDANFNDIASCIANVLAGEDDDSDLEPPPSDPNFHATGKVSYFGGPDDDGVSPSEGLAFIFDVDQAPQLFLPCQPEGTTGLARRLNPYVPYLACRFDYNITPKDMLAGDDVALVRAVRTGIAIKAFPADWGPHGDTDRVADLSPGLMDYLGIETDDEVEVIYPWRED